MAAATVRLMFSLLFFSFIVHRVPITQWRQNVIALLLFVLLHFVFTENSSNKTKKTNMYATYKRIWKSTHCTRYVQSSWLNIAQTLYRIASGILHAPNGIAWNKKRWRKRRGRAHTLAFSLINSNSRNISITLHFPNDVFDFIGFSLEILCASYASAQVLGLAIQASTNMHPMRTLQPVCFACTCRFHSVDRFVECDIFSLRFSMLFAIRISSSCAINSIQAKKENEKKAH